MILINILKGKIDDMGPLIDIHTLNNLFNININIINTTVTCSVICLNSYI